MKKILGIMITGALIAGMAATVEAATKREKKNEPKNKNAAIELIKAAGEEHFPEKMKVREVGSIKMEKTYYHIYCGALRGGSTYHVIVFDNTPAYLGYYKSSYEPADVEEGAILIDTGDSDDEGNTEYAKIRVKETGPTDGTTIQGEKVRFVEAPEQEKPKTVESADGTEGSSEIAYREWTITLGGKKHKVRAIYVSQTFGKVTLRAEASGKENSFPISSISSEDQAYIKPFK